MRKPGNNVVDIKNYIARNMGEVELTVHLGRNRFENMRGEIQNIYPAVFTVVVDNLIKTFSYSSVACGDVKIKRVKKSL